MSEPSFEEFRQRAGQDFELHVADDRVVPMSLSSCVPTGPGGCSSCFSLTFRAGPDAPIEQATYLVSSKGFGPEPIFLVPVRQVPADPRPALEYEAVFNRGTGGRAGEGKGQERDE